MTSTVLKIPPDGGYGWVIVFAFALNNFITIPLISCFGLIFKDTFLELGLSATQGSLIINLNVAFGMITGLINGALLKYYGCRKTATIAAFFLTLGVCLTSSAKSFTHFVLSFGLVTSLGIGLSQSAFDLALNTYFHRKRSIAMGLAMTVTGFGPVLIPQLLGLLLKMYSPEDVTLIYGAICGNVLVAATLLQPVKWHMKGVKEQTELLHHQKIEREEKRGVYQTVVEVFDLDLLKDPIFVNIMFGMAIAIFAELNFAVLTPFMLNDYGLNTSQIATFLSTLGVADIIFRFVAPHIGNYFTQPPRFMFCYGLIMLTITRYGFLLSSDYYTLLVVASGIGMAKGIRKVYMSLVIPAHVPLDKLASANGIMMMMNGICIIIGGAILGIVRDITGSYALCIVIMNSVTLTTILLWTSEAIFVTYWKRRKRRNDDVNNI